MRSSEDTISAIATGMTDSGIGIVRISGEKAIEIGDELFRSPSGKKTLSRVKTHVLTYGYVVEHDAGEDDVCRYHVVDEAMAVVMRSPRSYTGEDTVEIQCHGGVFVMQKILDLSLKAGARLAEPGEFTRRAFLNGRIDLTKAEAVMDLIHSRNESALASSVRQLKGSLAEKVKEMRDAILYEVAWIESALDDPEHVSMEGHAEKFRNTLNQLSTELNRLISTADEGKLIREGIDTVILGKPNAGKSSLINLLLGEERAIVTDVAGTTRDVLRESVNLGGVCLNVADTAGIRETPDAVEKIGVERAKESAAKADLILYVVDTSVPLDERDREILPILQGKKVIVLLNKSDLQNRVSEADLEGFLGALRKTFSMSGNTEGSNVEGDDSEGKMITVRTSAKETDGVDELKRAIRDLFFHGELKVNQELMITNKRHKEALQEAYEALQLVQKSVEDGMPEDFYSIDLMSAHASLGRITGEEVDDDLVEEIFSKFCMGK